MKNQGLATFRTTAIAAAIALMLGTASAEAVVFSCPTANNVDTDPATVVDCTVDVSGNIHDLDVSLAIEGGGWIDDLEIILSHNGVSVGLYESSADNGGVMDAVFDDAAAGPPPASGNVIGTFQPEGPGTLADFNGLPFSGLWQLSIHDDVVSGDGEDLVRFQLIAQIPEPSSLALLGLGLAAGGILIRRRRKAKHDR